MQRVLFDKVRQFSCLEAIRNEKKQYMVVNNRSKNGFQKTSVILRNIHRLRVNGGISSLETFGVQFVVSEGAEELGDDEIGFGRTAIVPHIGVNDLNLRHQRERRSHTLSPQFKLTFMFFSVMMAL